MKSISTLVGAAVSVCVAEEEAEEMWEARDERDEHLRDLCDDGHLAQPDCDQVPLFHLALCVLCVNLGRMDSCVKA